MIISAVSTLSIDSNQTSSYSTAMTTTTTWQVTLEAIPDSDDLALPLHQELLDLKDWKEGDNLEFIDNKDGTWTLKKS